jgi:hypothetical protein
MKTVGGRWWLVNAGGLAGGLAAAVLALPFAIVLGGWLPVLVSITAGMFLGQGLMLSRTTVPSARARLLRAAMWWGLAGLLVGSALAVTFLPRWRPLGPIDLVFSVGLVMLVAAKGAGYGLLSSARAVYSEEQQEQRAVREGFTHRTPREASEAASEDAHPERVRVDGGGQIAEAAKRPPTEGPLA